MHEHRRMRPVLNLARQLDIATNPAPEAVFEAGSAGFLIWCTPDDHPKGWDRVDMTAGAFSKPCEYVASVSWGWESERITHLLALHRCLCFGTIPIHTQPPSRYSLGETQNPLAL